MLKSLFSKTNIGWIDLAKTLIESDFTDFIVVGGLPRSGTTYVGKLLHQQETMFCFEEFMPLKSNQAFEYFTKAKLSSDYERSLKSKNDNLNWREIPLSEDHKRLNYLLISALAAGTSSNAIQGKLLNKIKTLACKTPTSECTYLQFQDYLYPKKCQYIHVVRDPWLVAASNWQMNWTNGTDQLDFLSHHLAHLRLSEIAYLKIVDSGSKVKVVYPDLLWSGLGAADFLSQHFGIRFPRDLNGEISDHWPKENRRNVEKLDQGLKAKFFESPEVIQWCKTFKMSQNLSTYSTDLK